MALLIVPLIHVMSRIQSWGMKVEGLNPGHMVCFPCLIQPWHRDVKAHTGPQEVC